MWWPPPPPCAVIRAMIRRSNHYPRLGGALDWQGRPNPLVVLVDRTNGSSALRAGATASAPLGRQALSSVVAGGQGTHRAPMSILIRTARKSSGRRQPEALASTLDARSCRAPRLFHVKRCHVQRMVVGNSARTARLLDSIHEIGASCNRRYDEGRGKEAGWCTSEMKHRRQDDRPIIDAARFDWRLSA